MPFLLHPGEADLCPNPVLLIKVGHSDLSGIQESLRIKILAVSRHSAVEKVHGYSLPRLRADEAVMGPGRDENKISRRYLDILFSRAVVALPFQYQSQFIILMGMRHEQAFALFGLKGMRHKPFYAGYEILPRIQSDAHPLGQNLYRPEKDRPISHCFCYHINMNADTETT